MDTGRVPRTEEIAQPTTGVHDARDHRIKAVGSLPVASSSAACLVLTTCHPCAGCAQACSSFMISATLPGGLGLPKRAAGFSLGLVLFFPPAIPGRSVVGSGLLGKLGPHLKATVPGAWGSKQEGRGQGGGMETSGNAVRVFGPIRPSLCTCTGELPVCLHEERPGRGALASMVVPSLAFAGWGSRLPFSRTEAGEKGLVVQRRRTGYAVVVVVMANASEDFFL